MLRSADSAQHDNGGRPKLFLIAGEMSGDTHGAGLITALKALAPDIEFHGLGGPRMNDAGGDGVVNWTDQAAVLGLWEVLKKYAWFRKQFDATIARIEKVAPDAVIFIDYPGFNLRMARALRTRLPQLRLIYYISPQVWAWNRGRIPKMARTLDLMLCIFPFEQPLYDQSGLKTFFVGHPLVDSLARQRTTVEHDEHLVGLFPGSREREIRKIFPIMIEAAARMRKSRPELRFEASAATEALEKEMRSMLARSSLRECRIGVNKSHSLMQRATVGMVASGTATVEAAYFGLPFAIVYRVAWLTYVAARMVIKLRHIGMVNILADETIVREFLQHDATPEAIADELLRLVNDEQARAKMVGDLQRVTALLGEGGASRKAAETILGELGMTAAKNPKPS